MLNFKIKKEFVDNELINNPGKPEPGKPEKIRKRYNVGDTIEFNCDSDGHGPDRTKIDRLIVFGIIDRTPQKKRGRKPKVERAVVL